MSKLLVRFYDIGSLVAFISMMACVSLEVVTRNLLHLPTPWAEEASRFFCVWAVFMGSASAWHRNSHIIINVIPHRLQPRPRAMLQMFAAIMTAIFLLCVWFGTLAIMFIQYEAKTTALEVSISYFYLGLFVGATGMVIFHLQMMRDTFMSIKGLAQTGNGN